MPKIPEKAYKTCENMLYQRFDLIASAAEQLREARERAYSAGSQAMDPVGGGKGTPSGDGVTRRAITAAEAAARLEKAMKWDECLSKLDRIYPASTKEGRAAWLLYGWRTGAKMSAEKVARVMNVDKKTVLNYRDTYVCNCALVAVSMGLLRIWEEENHGDL